MSISLRSCLVALALALASPCLADDDPIEFALRFPAPHTHYVEVEAVYPTDGESEVVLFMATWTPGSYLVRDYSRHVEEITAFVPGSVPRRELTIEKSAKNRWRIDNPNRGPVAVQYRVYCREMTVRTNWVDESFAMLNGAPTFLGWVNELDRLHRVTLTLPDYWARSISGLASDPDRPEAYVAADYDTLVDSPIVAGNPSVYRFEVGGKPHYLANVGEGGIWDGEQSAEEVRKIVEVQTEFWGEIPYSKYVFLNVIAEAGGGLEHRNSTLMLTSRWNSRVADRRRRWLGLVSHEFFHTWNVKRLRPVELGPFDYEREVLTPSLWIVEGFTSYYDDLSLVRAGLMTEKQYLEVLSQTIGRVEKTAGRRIRSLALASKDAWIRHYRPDENSRNTTISYYSKGALVGLLLDAEVRRATSDERSLDDVMRLAYARYSGEQGYTPEQFYACASEVAGRDLSRWFGETVESTRELDYGPLLAHYGLRFADPERREDKDAKSTAEKSDADAPIPGWIGLVTRDSGGRLLVSRVDRDTPAYAAGFNVDDEILAVDTYRVLPGEWSDRLKQYSPGDRAAVVIARRQRLLTIDVTFEKEPADPWKIELDPDASAEAKEARRRWLHLPLDAADEGATAPSGS